MGAQFAMYGSTSHAYKNAQIPTGPSRVAGTAIGALGISRLSKQFMELTLIARLLPLADCCHIWICRVAVSNAEAEGQGSQGGRCVNN